MEVMSFKEFSKLRRFALLVAIFLISTLSFAETAQPLMDMKVTRKVAVLDIEGKEYENVTIFCKSITPNYLITDKYKVKVKVVDKKGKSIYKKTLKNVFLYVFSSGQIQVGKQGFNQIIITKSKQEDNYIGIIREKEGIY